MGFLPSVVLFLVFTLRGDTPTQCDMKADDMSAVTPNVAERIKGSGACRKPDG